MYSKNENMQTHLYKPIRDRLKLRNFIQLDKKLNKQFNTNITNLFPRQIVIWNSLNRRQYSCRQSISTRARNIISFIPYSRL